MPHLFFHPPRFSLQLHLIPVIPLCLCAPPWPNATSAKHCLIIPEWGWDISMAYVPSVEGMRRRHLARVVHHYQCHLYIGVFTARNVCSLMLDDIMCERRLSTCSNMSLAVACRKGQIKYPQFFSTKHSHTAFSINYINCPAVHALHRHTKRFCPSSFIAGRVHF